MLIKNLLCLFSLSIFAFSSSALAATNISINCGGSTYIYDVGRGSTAMTLHHNGVGAEGTFRYAINLPATRTLLRVDAEAAVMTFKDANGEALRVTKWYAPIPTQPTVIIPMDAGPLGKVYVVNEGLDAVKFTRKIGLIFEVNGVKVTKTGCTWEGALLTDRDAAFSAAGWLKAFK